MPVGDTLELEIAALGDGGDGVAQHHHRRVFVPFTLPGERWRVSLVEAGRDHDRAVPLERLEGPPRAHPPCPYFGRCGGCALQHLPPAEYLAFKVARIDRAMARAGLDVPVTTEIRSSPLGSRRRVRLAFRKGRGRSVLGYRELRQHRLVDVEACPIAKPELQATFGPLRIALGELQCLAREAELLLSTTPAGVDLLLDARIDPNLRDLERLTTLAVDTDLARVTLRLRNVDLPVLTRRAPRLPLGPLGVAVPPGAFLQATEEGERALQEAAIDWLAECASLLDLFGGLGTLSLPLATRDRPLLLYDRAADPIAAVNEAARQARLGRVRAQCRDLDRQPVQTDELERYGAVILDPPRAGAATQVRELARTRQVERIAYASCYPPSFARDAALLRDGGWRLVELRPIDQFLFSAAVELIALFIRP